MPDEKPKNDDSQENRRSSHVQVPEPQIGSTHTTIRGSETRVPEPTVERVETKERNSLVDGRLDPDAQSPDDEHAKPFDPNENNPA